MTAAPVTGGRGQGALGRESLRMPLRESLGGAAGGPRAEAAAGGCCRARVAGAVGDLSLAVAAVGPQDAQLEPGGTWRQGPPRGRSEQRTPTGLWALSLSSTSRNFHGGPGMWGEGQVCPVLGRSGRLTSQGGSLCRILRN